VNFAHLTHIDTNQPKPPILPARKIFAKLLELRANVIMFWASVRETAFAQWRANGDLDPFSVGIAHFQASIFQLSQVFTFLERTHDFQKQDQVDRRCYRGGDFRQR
jgi:hypothetical protein